MARTGAERAPPPPVQGAVFTENPKGNIIEEMHPAMVAITATAHALDGLYDEIRPLAQLPASKGRPKRQRRILEALKHAFKVGKHGQIWLGELDWLFDLRDPAVHPVKKTGPPIPHPSGWGNFAAEYTEYSADAAERALALLESVLRTCVANPRELSRPWAEGDGKAAPPSPSPSSTGSYTTPPSHNRRRELPHAQAPRPPHTATSRPQPTWGKTVIATGEFR
jgi:hypothetical protein